MDVAEERALRQRVFDALTIVVAENGVVTS